MKKTIFMVAMAALIASCGNKSKQEATSLAGTDTTATANESALPQYQDFEQADPSGKMMKLSQFVGNNKLTLVDFWASWCPPCRAEMPNLVKAYGEFKDKGLEIVGVSLDEDKAAWTGALEQMNMTWPQMSDLQGWDNAAVALYGVRGIPHTLLVNQKGEIVAQNLRGEDLHRVIAEYLK